MLIEEISDLADKLSSRLKVTLPSNKETKTQDLDNNLKVKKKSSKKSFVPKKASLKFYDDLHYSQTFLPLFIMETDVAKSLELSKRVDDLSLRWKKAKDANGKDIVNAFFTLTDEQKDVMRLEYGKFVCLEYKGPEKPFWNGVGIVSTPFDEDNEIEETRVRFDFLGNLPMHHKENFSISLVWNNVKSIRVIKAMEKFTKGGENISDNLKQALIGNFVKPKQKNNFDPVDFSEVNLPALNPNQMDAVQSSLQNTITLIQGPPGTGKTVTSAMIVYALVKKYKEKVLVCASSNVAVDNLAEKIHLTGLKSIRIFAKSLEEQTKSTNFPALHLTINEILNKSKNSGENIEEIEASILLESEVILCTCIGAGDSRILGYDFKTVLLDEGTQTIEPECLIPLVKGCKRAILVGDHKQLSPVVINKEAAKMGLDQSMFERLIKLNFPINKLITQFRAHPNLIAFPNKEFYDGLLQNGVTSESRIDKSCRFKWPNPDTPTFFYCNLGFDEKQDSGTSFVNKTESIKCIDVINQLLTTGASSSQIAVITPYLGQQLYLSRELKRKDKKKYKHVEIASVDAFQGREKDYIIISCVRSNSFRSIGFLKDPRRLNVALTRARFGLIIIGNPNTLVGNALWRRLISHYQDAGTLVDGPVTNLKPMKFDISSLNKKSNSRSRRRRERTKLRKANLILNSVAV